MMHDNADDDDAAAADAKECVFELVCDEWR